MELRYREVLRGARLLQGAGDDWRNTEELRAPDEAGLSQRGHLRRPERRPLPGIARRRAALRYQNLGKNRWVLRNPSEADSVVDGHEGVVSLRQRALRRQERLRRDGHPERHPLEQGGPPADVCLGSVCADCRREAEALELKDRALAEKVDE